MNDITKNYLDFPKNNSLSINGIQSELTEVNPNKLAYDSIRKSQKIQKSKISNLKFYRHKLSIGSKLSEDIHNPLPNKIKMIGTPNQDQQDKSKFETSPIRKKDSNSFGENKKSDIADCYEVENGKFAHGKVLEDLNQKLQKFDESAEKSDKIDENFGQITKFSSKKNSIKYSYNNQKNKLHNKTIINYKLAHTNYRYNNHLKKIFQKKHKNNSNELSSKSILSKTNNNFFYDWHNEQITNLESILTTTKTNFNNSIVSYPTIPTHHIKITKDISSTNFYNENDKYFRSLIQQHPIPNTLSQNQPDRRPNFSSMEKDTSLNKKGKTLPKSKSTLITPSRVPTHYTNQSQLIDYNNLVKPIELCLSNRTREQIDNNNRKTSSQTISNQNKSSLVDKKFPVGLSKRPVFRSNYSNKYKTNTNSSLGYYINNFNLSKFCKSPSDFKIDNWDFPETEKQNQYSQNILDDDKSEIEAKLFNSNKKIDSNLEWLNNRDLFRNDYANKKFHETFESSKNYTDTDEMLNKLDTIPEVSKHRSQMAIEFTSERASKKKYDLSNNRLKTDIIKTALADADKQGYSMRYNDLQKENRRIEFHNKKNSSKLVCVPKDAGMVDNKCSSKFLNKINFSYKIDKDKKKEYGVNFMGNFGKKNTNGYDLVGDCGFIEDADVISNGESFNEFVDSQINKYTDL